MWNRGVNRELSLSIIVLVLLPLVTAFQSIYPGIPPALSAKLRKYGLWDYKRQDRHVIRIAPDFTLLDTQYYVAPRRHWLQRGTLG